MRKKVGNVIFTDFKKTKKAKNVGFGGGPGFFIIVFLSVVFISTAIAAITLPEKLDSTLFGALVLAFATGAAIVAKRIFTKAQIDIMHRRATSSSREQDDDHRILH